MSTQAELDAFVPGTQLVARGDVPLVPGCFYSSIFEGTAQSHHPRTTKTLFKCLDSVKRALFVDGQYEDELRIMQNIQVLADDRRDLNTLVNNTPAGMIPGWSGLSVETLADPKRTIVHVEPDELPQYMNMPNKYPEWDNLLRDGFVRELPRRIRQTQGGADDVQATATRGDEPQAPVQSEDLV